jgi:hypothetical protein
LIGFDVDLFISAISGERSEPKNFWGVFFFRAKKTPPPKIFRVASNVLIEKMNI